jgi:hypothetical protein
MRVTRWARYGHERLYVNCDDGRRVGWLDLKTGQSTIEIPAVAEAFNAALAAYLNDGGPGAQARCPSPAQAPVVPWQREPAGLDLSMLPPPVAPVVEPGWEDLALNRPGQGVRAEADAARAAAWSRSKVGTVLALATDTNTRERRWRVGAKGEEKVGARLERLVEHGWRVLHSVPIGPGKVDLDHLLIGTGGVYCINTKNRPDGQVWVGANQVRVNGHRTGYVEAARREGDRTSRILSGAVGWPVPVRPTLIILTGTLFPMMTVKEQPDGVVVLDRLAVPGWFRKTKPRLSTEQVDAVYDHARRSSIWSR